MKVLFGAPATEVMVGAGGRQGRCRSASRVSDGGAGTVRAGGEAAGGVVGAGELEVAVEGDALDEAGGGAVDGGGLEDVRSAGAEALRGDGVVLDLEAEEGVGGGLAVDAGALGVDGVLGGCSRCR